MDVNWAVETKYMSEVTIEWKLKEQQKQMESSNVLNASRPLLLPPRPLTPFPLLLPNSLKPQERNCFYLTLKLQDWKCREVQRQYDLLHEDLGPARLPTSPPPHFFTPSAARPDEDEDKKKSCWTLLREALLSYCHTHFVSPVIQI